MAVSQAFGNEKFNPNDMRVRFEVNKFQHAQIELQEKLRTQLGLRTDIPLLLGLAEKSSDPAEQNLLYNFRLLQAMDKLSLCICCTKPPFGKIDAMTDRPGGRMTPLTVSRPEPQTLLVSPWPFDQESIEVSFPFLGRMPALRDLRTRKHFRNSIFVATKLERIHFCAAVRLVHEFGDMGHRGPCKAICRD